MPSLRSALRRFRSAITGCFMSRRYAEEHPDTTVSETDEP